MTDTLIVIAPPISAPDGGNNAVSLPVVIVLALVLQQLKFGHHIMLMAA
ncbi:hypothetical protein [Enterobacter sp. R1(2018)]|nr:hypothetical protein [Enterobacter sp. R1(2018)]